jgi:acetylornithine deacetylase
VVEKRADAPPLRVDRDSAAERFIRTLTGDNDVKVAAFATEAGQFQHAGFPAVICGPGYIEQAHQPDEFVALSELEKGMTIFRRFVDLLKT